MQKLLLLSCLICLPFVHAFAQTRYVDNLGLSVQKQSLSYAKKDRQNLKLDVYAPANDTFSQKPVMIWVHGGGFSGGTRDNEKEVRLMNELAQRGYVAVSISYRLLQKGKEEGFGCDCSREQKMKVFKESAEDLLDAVLFVKSNKEAWGIDEDKIIIGGSSAGAETVLNAAFMRDYFFAEKKEYLDLKFAAVLSLAGAMVDRRYLTEKNAIPALLFHGTADKLVPYGTAPHHYCAPNRAGYIWLDGSQSIAKKLEDLGKSYLFDTVLGGNHDVAQIPFDKVDLICSFLHTIVLEGGHKVLSIEGR